MLNIKRDTLLPRYKLATSYKIKVPQALYLRWEDFKNHILLLKQSSFNCVTHWNSSHRTAKENKSKKKRGTSLAVQCQDYASTSRGADSISGQDIINKRTKKENKSESRVKGFLSKSLSYVTFSTICVHRACKSGGYKSKDYGAGNVGNQMKGN